MKKYTLSLILLVMLAGCGSLPSSFHFFTPLPDGVTLIEEVNADAGKVVIPYKKYRLANGLTLVLSEDHSDPLVHVDVTYHVGSAREELGKSGFAHFFEHMMFQGSKHVADQEHFRLITEAGGRLNGTTNRDRTNYYQTVPANQLEKVLWLESDRMGFLLDAVSQAKFEIQRDTVKNERAQNYDNRPYGLIWEKMSEALFPAEHPYSWQTIGYVEDLDRVNVNDLKAFFLKWYGPNNAVLTIGGDINIEQTLAWVNQYFSSIAPAPKVLKAPKKPVTLEQDRFITLEDLIAQPMVIIGWPTAYLGAQEQMALDLLAEVLGSGTNSLLYQQLVKTQKAVDAGAFQDCGELACSFYVYAMAPANSPESLTQLHQELLALVQSVKAQGIDETRLAQIRGKSRADAIWGLSSVQGKVSQLAYNQTFFGQPDRIEQQLAVLDQLEIDDIIQVYEAYLENKPKVTLSVVEQSKAEQAVQAPNFSPPPRKLLAPSTTSEPMMRAPLMKENWDRSQVPKVAQAVSNQLPALYEHYFDNGSELLGIRSQETPTVFIEFKFPAGERQVNAGKEGLAQLTAALLTEGSALHSWESIQAQLDELGSQISVYTSTYATQVSVSSLTENLAQTLALAQEVMQQPAFNAADFERIKQQQRQSLIYQQQQPEWLAAQARRQVLYGDSLFSRNNAGTLASLDALTLEDVKQFYQQHYTPNGAQIIVVGDLSLWQARRQLALFAQWQGEPAPLLHPQTIPAQEAQKIYLVDKADAPQTILNLVRLGLPFDATGEHYLTQLANFNLAGNFNSRINQNLREDKGYTYGAGSYFLSNREVGSIVFSAPVRAQVTLAALEQLLQEMQHYSQQGMTEQEMHFLRLAVGQQEALSYETPGQKAQLLSQILAYSLDKDYLQQRNQLVQTVDKSTLDRLANQWFDPNYYQIIVVGDAKTIKPQLEKLAIPIVELEITY